MGAVNRVEYLDTAKGLGILMVCIGHACTNHGVIAECPNADIIRFVTLFHMALFFFINGMLYNEKYSREPIKGIFKKVKAYYIPFVTYNLIFWLLHNVFARFHLISGQMDSKDYAYTDIRTLVVTFLKTIVGFRQRFAGAMWFLECLIIISVVFILLDYLANRFFPKRRILILSLGVILVVLCNRLFNLLELPHVPSSISQMIYWGLNGLLFFYLGFLCRQFQWNDRLKKHKSVWIVCLFAVLVIAVICVRPGTVSVITNASIPVYRYGVRTFVGGNEITGLPLLQYICYAAVCLSGIIMTLLFSQCRFVSESRILKLVGSYSLHIMCLHFLAFKLVSLVIVCIYQLPVSRLAEYPVLTDVNGAWWIAYTIIGCLVPVGIVKVYEKGKMCALNAWNKKKGNV